MLCVIDFEKKSLLLKAQRGYVIWQPLWKVDIYLPDNTMS